MIVWRGYGGMVFAVVFVCALVANFLANIYGGKQYWDNHGWPLAASLGFSAVVLWAIDLRLSKIPQQTLINETTGERVTLVRQHDFFFIRLHWWPLILAFLAALILLSRWSPGSA